MDNKYNENLGASSDDRDEAEDLFLRVVKRNDQQSHEASQNKHINNMIAVSYTHLDVYKRQASDPDRREQAQPDKVVYPPPSMKDK